jgi:hypothetical protein
VNAAAWRAHDAAVCKAKVQYRSRHIADQAAALFAWRGRRVHSYRCKTCRLFHLASDKDRHAYPSSLLVAAKSR